MSKVLGSRLSIDNFKILAITIDLSIQIFCKNSPNIKNNIYNIAEYGLSCKIIFKIAGYWMLCSHLSLLTPVQEIILLINTYLKFVYSIVSNTLQIYHITFECRRSHFIPMGNYQMAKAKSIC